MSTTTTYHHLQVQHGDGWRTLSEVGLDFGLGYIAARRDQPGPVAALRLVRSDGHVVDETSAREAGTIGSLTGTPEPGALLADAVRLLKTTRAALSMRLRSRSLKKDEREKLHGFRDAVSDLLETAEALVLVEVADG